MKSIQTRAALVIALSAQFLLPGTVLAEEKAAAPAAQDAAAAPAPTGRKSCDTLKEEITAKLEAKGVKGYELNVVDAAEVGDATIVGSCEAGTKKISYTRK